MSTFSLVNQPFVPAQRATGLARESLTSLSADAHEIVDLDWSSGVRAASILGILGAIYRDSCRVETPEDFVALWRRGRFPDEVLDYLAEHADRFDLFDEDRPFLQSPTLQVSGGPKPVTVLQLEAATGNNVPVFSSVTEATVEPLSPADAALNLVTVMAYDTAALKSGAHGDPQAKGGKTTGNQTGPLGQMGLVAVIGRNLFETIMLNSPIRPLAPRDRPAWRTDPPIAAWQKRQPLGDMDLATWPSRRVMLSTTSGAAATEVTGGAVTAGDRVLNLVSVEWRTGWWRVDKPKPGEPPIRPRRHQFGRDGWRGLAQLLAVGDSGSDSGYVSPVVLSQLAEVVDELPELADCLSLQMVGVAYGNQSAVIEDVYSERVPLPTAALTERDEGANVRSVIYTMSEQTSLVVNALNDLEANLRRALGGESIPRDKGQHLGDSFASSLRIDAHRVLEGLGRDPAKYAEASLVWERLLRRKAGTMASDVLDQVPSKAWPEIVKPARPGEVKPEVKWSIGTVEKFFWAALSKALPATAPQSQATALEETHE